PPKNRPSVTLHESDFLKNFKRLRSRFGLRRIHRVTPPVLPAFFFHLPGHRARSVVPSLPIGSAKVTAFFFSPKYFFKIFFPPLPFTSVPQKTTASLRLRSARLPNGMAKVRISPVPPNVSRPGP
ncbi:hypothetical protein, partial [Olivibacter jilunii]